MLALRTLMYLPLKIQQLITCKCVSQRSHMGGEGEQSAPPQTQAEEIFPVLPLGQIRSELSHWSHQTPVGMPMQRGTGGHVYMHVPPLC